MPIPNPPPPPLLAVLLIVVKIVLLIFSSFANGDVRLRTAIASSPYIS
jgi:hypothetical protein